MSTMTKHITYHTRLPAPRYSIITKLNVHDLQVIIFWSFLNRLQLSIEKVAHYPSVFVPLFTKMTYLNVCVPTVPFGLSIQEIKLLLRQKIKINKH